MLGVILMVGGVIGAQFGARIGQNIRGDQLRALLALLVLAVAVRFLVGLVTPPDERYSLDLAHRGQPVRRLARSPSPLAADRRRRDGARPSA